MVFIEKFIQFIDFSKLIAEKKGNNVLREFMRLIYFKTVTGHGPELYFLYGLYEKDKKVWRDFLGKSQMVRMLHRVNKASDFWIMDDKVEFYLFCKKKGLPLPEILCVINPEKEYQGVKYLNTLEEFCICMEELGTGNYIFKPVDGSYGDGIFSVSYDSSGFINLSDNKVLSCSEMYENMDKRSYLIQFTQVPSDYMKQIMPFPACGTLRIISYFRKDGKIDVPFSLITIPVKGQVISNFVHGSSGNLSAWIHPESGTFGKVYGFGKDGFVQSFEKHPDTSIKFEGLKVPDWQSFLETAKKGAVFFPNIRFIGWDFIATEKGQYILEANPMSDPDLIQLTRGKGLRMEMEELLDN